MSEKSFDLVNYLNFIDNRIKDILSRPSKDNLTYDILDTEKSKINKMIILKEKHRQMKIGEIWQEVLGNYNGYINLKIGNDTGLDIISYSKKIVIELKNRTNTDNYSSKKANFDKLANFKKNNPDYRCIYANINDNTENKTLKGINKKIIHNGIEIEQLVGYEFLKLILGNDTEIIIDFIRNAIDKYI